MQKYWVRDVPEGEEDHIIDELTEALKQSEGDNFDPKKFSYRSGPSKSKKSGKVGIYFQLLVPHLWYTTYLGELTIRISGLSRKTIERKITIKGYRKDTPEKPLIDFLTPVLEGLKLRALRGNKVVCDLTTCCITRFSREEGVLEVSIGNPNLSVYSSSAVSR